MNKPLTLPTHPPICDTPFPPYISPRFLFFPHRISYGAVCELVQLELRRSGGGLNANVYKEVAEFIRSHTANARSYTAPIHMTIREIYKTCYPGMYIIYADSDTLVYRRGPIEDSPISAPPPPYFAPHPVAYMSISHTQVDDSCAMRVLA